jgi:SAM-dependent methyltransferase
MRESESAREASHWRSVGAQWALQESPGLPSPEDIAFYEQSVADWHAQARPASVLALLLGVTPEIALMRWPAGAEVVAVDQSQGMIGAVWPGARPGHAAVCARWTELPLAAASRDVAIGDGCYSCLDAAAYRVMSRALREVLRPGGLLVMRFFVRPEARESTAQVFADLFAKRIGSFFAFKWRLAMALHGTLAEGVRLADVWDAWHAAVPQPEALARHLDWSLPKILMMDHYRKSELRYTFPTLAEARVALEDDFREIACRVPYYELGTRCPTLILQPR